jgi:hypothetical protein
MGDYRISGFVIRVCPPPSYPSHLINFAFSKIVFDISFVRGTNAVFVAKE